MWIIQPRTPPGPRRTGVGKMKSSPRSGQIKTAKTCKQFVLNNGQQRVHYPHGFCFVWIYTFISKRSRTLKQERAGGSVNFCNCSSTQLPEVESACHVGENRETTSIQSRILSYYVLHSKVHWMIGLIFIRLKQNDESCSMLVGYDIRNSTLLMPPVHCAK